MIELQTINVILGIGIILDLGLGALLFYLAKGKAANQLFSLWMIGLASWTITMVGFFNADTAGDALAWMRASYVVAIISILSFWYFATQFPEERKLNALVHIANILTLGVFGYLLLSTDIIVRDITARPWHLHVDLNPVGWWIYAVFLFYYFLSAHALLIRSYFRASGVMKSQLLFVIGGVFVGAELGGATFNLILPSPLFMNWDYVWLGPTFSTMFIVPFVAYAVAKHRLFTIKTMLTQIFVSYIAVFTIIDFLISETTFDLIIRAFLVIGVFTFGILLVRRVNDDDRRREELEDLSRKLQEANKELRELDKAKSEFINIASHQLRTPVSVIKGYLALLEEGAYGKLTEKVKDKVRQMFEMNERLVHLINNFLNMSRIEKKRIEFLVTPADLGRTLKQAVEEMRFEAQSKGLDIDYVVNAKELPFVKADIEKVHEVMVNLIDNAVKYSEEGTRVTVTADVTISGDFVIVRVSDSGIGLTDEEKGRLFEKYYRADSKDMPHQQGSGLGLYICRTFIEGMGGRIWVDASEKGKGTTFAFELPVDKEDPLTKKNPA